jgi:hypothetical protein
MLFTVQQRPMLRDVQMKPCKVSIVLIMAAAYAIACGQNGLPAFTGTWKLDLHLSKLETKSPPIASTAKISYDGKVWHFSRTHHFPDGKADTWSTTMIVDSKKPRIQRFPPITSTSRMTRDGSPLVLNEELRADSEEHGTNTVRYTLSEDGQTLTEDEREGSPDGNEHNVWILKREPVKR